MWGTASQLVYLVLAAVGVPVLAGLGGGPAVLFGRTGGYVIGYLLAALLTGVLAPRGAFGPAAGGGHGGGVPGLLRAGHRLVHGHHRHFAVAEPCALRAAVFCPAMPPKIALAAALGRKAGAPVRAVKGAADEVDCRGLWPTPATGLAASDATELLATPLTPAD